VEVGKLKVKGVAKIIYDVVGLLRLVIEFDQSVLDAGVKIVGGREECALTGEKSISYPECALVPENGNQMVAVLGELDAVAMRWYLDVLAWMLEDVADRLEAYEFILSCLDLMFDDRDIWISTQDILELSLHDIDCKLFDAWLCLMLIHFGE
jgi:hypothetical protein